jgi:hypothetical protein
VTHSAKKNETVPKASISAIKNIMGRFFRDAKGRLSRKSKSQSKIDAAEIR